MRQQRALRNEANRASENAAAAVRMLQGRALRYGETIASENAAHTEWMSQHILLRDGANCASKMQLIPNVPFSSCSHQHCGHTHNPIWLAWQWEYFNPHTVTLNSFLGIHSSQKPRKYLRSTDNRFRDR